MLIQLNSNPYEHEFRRPVDFGHWLSPQLEMVDAELLHGEAVAIDMALTLTVARERRWLSFDDWDAAIELLLAWNLPLTHDAVSTGLVRDSLARTVRHRAGAQNIPLSIGPGRCRFVDDLTVDEVLLAHRALVRDLARPTAA